MIIDEHNAGGSVDIDSGETLVLRLKENPTTGYRWAIEDADGLVLEDDRNEEGGAPGAKGVRVFRFRAAQPGIHTLRLKNWRSWEGEQSVTERFVAQIKVR